MFKTARTTARTALMAASTAGFVAFGAGIAGADTLGGVTDGLPLGDLGSQVPAQLTEGVSSPLGDLVKVEPGTVSATPEIDHQSNPVDGVLGEGAPVHAPIGDEANAANVGPLDLGSVQGAMPLAHAVDHQAVAAGDPVSDLLGGSGGDPVSGLLGGLLGGVNSGGGTLPLAHPVAASETPGSVGDVPAVVGEVLPMAAADTPVSLDPGENSDLTGGATTLLPAVGLPEPTAVLPMAAPDASSLTGLVPMDALGGDLVAVEGMPTVGQPQVDPGVTDMVGGVLA
ncbi:hypothetical protein BJF83_16785 [Nocardiopsis sp. CNR-923]|uniref:hypothetical protein n=1 Tax=Nocardiopsis sp. CNR-923 TaxID=1904965 RepID=UPI00095BAA9F|nr:hypothetical protein [Nocardiopsis sp. CNR-923]OLT27972.1 hypothetical protein BJF83_16785 [Nocardiopsis sp. CNR-923]